MSWSRSAPSNGEIMQAIYVILNFLTVTLKKNKETDEINFSDMFI